jgi:hypothetical protein
MSEVLKIKLRSADESLGLEELIELREGRPEIKWVFADVGKFIWKKHRTLIENHFKTNFDNEWVDESRLPIAFSYRDKAGDLQSAGPGEFLAKVAPQAKLEGDSAVILWDPVTTGGVTSALFSEHVAHLRDYLKRNGISVSPDTMKPLDPWGGDFSGGVKFKVRDKDLVERLLEIIPRKNYPWDPPIVTCTPEYTDDLCWRTGVLNYTTRDSDGKTVWYGNVEKYGKASFQPLIILVNEQIQKYKFIF